MMRAEPIRAPDPIRRPDIAEPAAVEPPAAMILPDPLAADPSVRAPIPAVRVKGAMTLFYYENLRVAVDFYQHSVGLQLVEDLGWCCIFELQPRSYLGLVDATAGSQRPISGLNKGALLSIETEDLEACLDRFKRLGIAVDATRIEPGCRGRTREFKIIDPGDYTVEFFTWLTPPPRLHSEI